MEFKGTKGKWYLDEEVKGAEVIGSELEIKGNIICLKPEEEYEESCANWKANAQLIAHAPEMLEMLGKIVKMESIICVGGASSEQYLGEEQALNNMINEVKLLIEKATTI